MALGAATKLTHCHLFLSLLMGRMCLRLADEFPESDCGGVGVGGGETQQKATWEFSFSELLPEEPRFQVPSCPHPNPSPLSPN